MTEEPKRPTAARRADLLLDLLEEVASVNADKIDPETPAGCVATPCGTTGSSDITDVSVAVIARERSLRVITSDPDDIRRIDAGLDIVPV